MSGCEALSDKMPLVSQGSAEWTPEEASHLSGCADCGAEWRLIQVARRLGGDSARRIDPARLGRRVLAQLGAERRRRRWLRGGGLVGLAAAAALALVVYSGDRGVSVGAPGPVAVAESDGFHLRLAELESLEAGELEAILDGLEAPLSEGAGGVPPALGDLDDTQLERVLRSLEG